MSKECWRCKQKREHFRQKLEAARLEAKEKVLDFGETMVIIKEGCDYLVKKASEVTIKGIEYISK